MSSGQQQILLIVLGLVVIGIAVAVGMSLFRAHAISAKRDLLTNETIDMAAQAIAYYKRAKEFGGGESRSLAGRFLIKYKHN